MKRVSFEVAKHLKEVGYPQEHNAPCYITENCTKSYNLEIITNELRLRLKTYKEGQYIEEFQFSDKRCKPPRCYAPTYLDVWLWLWREKKIYIGLEAESYPHDGMCVPSYIDAPYSDPEEAIIAAIEYLVTNDLIK